MENITGIIIAFISGVFGPISVMYIKHLLDKRKPKPDMVTEALRVGELVTNKIDHIREEFNADRVWITQFHNGGHFLHSNKSMQKFSVVYEVDAAGVLPVSTIFTNIPISLYSRCFSEMLTTKFIAIPNYEDETVATYGLKAGAEATGAKSSYIVGLFDFGTSKLMGSVGVDFLEPKQLTDSEIEYFKTRSERVAGYLSSNRQN